MENLLKRLKRALSEGFTTPIARGVARIPQRLGQAQQVIRPVVQSWQARPSNQIVKKAASNLVGNVRLLANPETASVWEGGFKNNIPGYLSRTFTYNYISPALQTPYRAKQLYSGVKNLNLADIAEGGLGTVGGIVSTLTPGLSDVLAMGYNYMKGWNKDYRQNPKTTLKSLNIAGLKAVSGEQPVGLGEAFSTNENTQRLLNIAELPLLVFAGKLGRGADVSFPKYTLQEAQAAFSDKEVRNIVGKFAEIVETNKNVNRANLGKLGQQIHLLAYNIFGRDAVTLSNTQLKNLFDNVFYQAAKMSSNRPKFNIKKIDLGLTTKNIRKEQGITQATKGEGATYKIINEGGIIKEVRGKPIKLVNGIETFIHEGDNPKRYIKGFVVSEKSTGRYIAVGETEREAITNAKNVINSVGEDKFRQKVSELSQIQAKGVEKGIRPKTSPIPPVSSEVLPTAEQTSLEPLAQEARKFKSADDIKSFISKNYGTKFTTARETLKGGHTYTEITPDGKLERSKIQLGKYSVNNVDTILHEFGHLINEGSKEDLYMRMLDAEGLTSLPELATYRKVFKEEMAKMKEIGIKRGVLREHMDELDEQLAEFVRVVFTDRKLAQELAPQTSKSFQKVILQDPKLTDFYNRATKEVDLSQAKEIPQVLEPLVQEARKMAVRGGTAEDFVNKYTESIRGAEGVIDLKTYMADKTPLGEGIKLHEAIERKIYFETPRAGAKKLPAGHMAALRAEIDYYKRLVPELSNFDEKSIDRVVIGRLEEKYGKAKYGNKLTEPIRFVAKNNTEKQIYDLIVNKLEKAQPISFRSQLIDIYNQATKGVSPQISAPTPPLSPTKRVSTPQAQKLTPPSKIEAVEKGMKERGFIKTVRESPTTAPEVAQGVQGTYAPKPNKQLMAEAKARIAKSYDKAKSFVMENTPKTPDELDQMIATGELLMEKAQNAKRFDEAIEIAEKLAEHGTQLGRGVQAFSIWGRLTPQGMLRYGEKMIKKAAKEGGLRIGKVEELTAKEKKLIVGYMQKAKQATTPEEQAKFVKLAMETINQKIPWKVSELFDFYRVNNVLTNPRSHMRNIWGNLINSFIVRPATLVAEGRPVEAAKYELGALKSLPQAIDDAVLALKGETLEFGKLDIETLRQKKAPLPISTSFRALEAMDKFFSRMIESGEVARGRTSEEAKKFADYLLYRTRIGDAKAQGWMLNFLDKSLGKMLTTMARIPVINWFVLFARTPFNVAKMQIEYSPIGFANLPGAAEKRTQIAKAGLGSLVTLLGAKLALEGKTTFAAPTDQDAREWFYATGRRPFSVQIGGKWIPAAYFGPFALALMLPAMYKYYSEEAPTALSSGDLEKMGQVASSIIYYWSQQTPLSGVGNFVDLARGRTDLSILKNLGFTASQVIPYTGLLNYAAQVLDPIYRKPKGFGEQIIAGIPELSKKVKEFYTTPTGEPAKRPLSAYLAPYTLGTPEEKYEPFYQERTKEIQQNKLINQIKKSIGEGREISPTEATLAFGEQAERAKEPLDVFVQRKKLQAQYEKADKLFDLYIRAPDDQTAQEIEKNVGNLGIDFNEGLYNYLSKQETKPKAEYVKAILGQIDEKDQLNTLVSLRKEGVVSGKAILSDGVIDQLYDEGLITSAQRKYLKGVKWSAKEKKLVSKAGGGKKITIGKPPARKKITITPKKAATKPLTIRTTPAKVIKIEPLSTKRLRVKSSRRVRVGNIRFKPVKAGFY